MIKVGNTIRSLRNSRNISQKELAEKAELTASFLSLVENDRRDPSLTVLRRIAAALEVPEEAIIWDSVSLPSTLSAKDLKICKAAKSIVQQLFESFSDGKAPT